MRINIAVCILLFSFSAFGQTTTSDSIAIRKSVIGFYKWYNVSWKKVESFSLYKSNNDKGGPPYRIDWVEAEKYFSYMRKNAPVGEAFIENERSFLQRVDQDFKDDPEEEMPVGFDYDRFTNSQEEPKWFWNELVKQSNVWTIIIDKTDDNKAVVFIQQPNSNQTSVLHLFFCGHLTRENGKWKMAAFDCEATKESYD